MNDLLSTVSMTVTPPDEGSVVEVSMTTTLHPAVMVNAVALATDFALRGILPDHPAHATGVRPTDPTHPLVVGVSEDGQVVVHNPEVLNGIGVLVLPPGTTWAKVEGL